MDLKRIEEICIKIQPLYEDYIFNYSKSYLQGAKWYIGENVLEWWKNANNIRYFTYNKLKLLYIIKLLKIHNENKLKYGLNYITIL